MGYLSPIGKDGVLPVAKDGATYCQEGWGYTPPPPSQEGWGYPLMKVEQTHTCENTTSRHPSDAGGNYSETRTAVFSYVQGKKTVNFKIEVRDNDTLKSKLTPTFLG